MKQLLYLVGLTLVPIILFAQANFDSELNSELDKMYDQSQVKNQNTQVSQAQQDVPVQAVQSTPIQVQMPVQQSVQQVPVVQQQVLAVPTMQQPMQVQKQPTTLIEAAPLVESRADQMRKQRQETELQTEQKIVEKLETSRIEDEKHRAEVLFGDKFNQISNGVQPAPQALPVVIQDPNQAKVDKDAVREEVSTALDDLKLKEEAKKNERKPYFSVLAGMGDYGIKNVRGNYSIGMAFGQKVRDRLLVEGQLSYGSYNIEQVNWYSFGYTYYPRITNMDQYQGELLLKYQILSGLFHPVIGGAVSYTYRSFNDIQFGSAANDATSQSFDMGLVAGADVDVSDDFTLGLDLQYMWNLTSRAQTNGLIPSFSQAINNGGTPIEKLGYMNISVVGRMSF